MDPVEEKTYRIWYKDGTLENSPGLKNRIWFCNDEIPEGQEKAISASFLQYPNCEFDIELEDLPLDIELDIVESEEKVFLLRFNEIPKICISNGPIPRACPHDSIIAFHFINILEAEESSHFLSKDDLSLFADWPNLRYLEISERGGLDLEFENAFEGLSNLTHLDLQGSECLRDVSGLGSLRNLKYLSLLGCGKIQNVDGLKGLVNLTSLNLSSCESLTCVNGLSTLSNLTKLDLEYCESLLDVDGLWGLKKLEFLDLYFCPLTNLDGLTCLINLVELKLPKIPRNYQFMSASFYGIFSALERLEIYNCKALEDLSCLAEMTNLKHLDLFNCQNLKNIDGLGELKNLEYLHLGWPESLETFEVLGRLYGLQQLNLSSASNLINLTDLRGLKNLSTLTIFSCKNLESLDGLSGVENLKSLSVQECTLENINELHSLRLLVEVKITWCALNSLQDLKVFRQHGNLRKLKLTHCNSLSDVGDLSVLEELEFLDLSNCPFVQMVAPLKECKSLRDFIFSDPAESIRVLSCTGRNDPGFLKSMTKEWLEVARKAPELDGLVCDLSDTFGLYANESWASDALSELVDLMLARKGNAESTWASLLAAVAKCPNQEAQEILGLVTQGINQERASSILRPLLKTLASLPESLKEWANERADELLESLDIYFLRDYGPSVCLFYVEMERKECSHTWLEKFTDPVTPLWRDRIHLALGQWEIEKGNLDDPRARLKEMSVGPSKDELLEALARALAKEKPLEAGELLDQISEEWRQATLSAELAGVPAFTEPAENAYRLLLHMERDPETLADWVESLIQNNPESELAQEVVRTFGPASEKSNELELSGLLDAFLASDAIKDRVLKKDRDVFRELILANQEGWKFKLSNLFIEEMKQQGTLTAEECSEIKNSFVIYS